MADEMGVTDIWIHYMDFKNQEYEEHYKNHPDLYTDKDGKLKEMVYPYIIKKD